MSIERLLLPFAVGALLVTACDAGTDEDVADAAADEGTVGEDIDPFAADTEGAEEAAADGDPDEQTERGTPSPAEDEGTDEQDDASAEDDAGAAEEAVDDGDDAESIDADGVALIAMPTSEHGPVVSKGLALYMFEGDADDEQECIGACADNWPPLLTDGEPVAAHDAVDQELLGTIERDDGDLQVTYADKPLYFHSTDRQPGQTNGQGSSGLFWLVTVDGDAARE